MKHTIELSAVDVVEAVKRSLGLDGYRIIGDPEVLVAVSDTDYYDNKTKPYAPFRGVRVQVEKVGKSFDK